MKRSLLVFTALASFAVPALSPVATLAQDRASQAEARSRSERPQRSARPDRSQQADRAISPQQRRDAPRQQRPRTETPRAAAPEARQPRQERPRTEPRAERPAQPRPGATERPRVQTPRPEARREDRPNLRPTNPGVTAGRRPDDNRAGANRPDRQAWESRDRNRDQSRDRDRDRDRNRWESRDRDRPGVQRPDRNWSRDRDRSYREFRNNWNRDRWQREWHQRHRADWWRNDSRFRGWSGVRIGFYFAPGYGYYSVPRAYWNRHYAVGQYLPDVFWRYTVNDWRTYGLGYPPAGTRWVYVDNSIYLIDEFDGYIIEVIRDAWRW